MEKILNLAGLKAEIIQTEECIDWYIDLNYLQWSIYSLILSFILYDIKCFIASILFLSIEIIRKYLFNNK